MNRDYDQMIIDYHDVLDELFGMLQILSGARKELKEWQSLAQDLVLKFILNAYSLAILFQGTDIKSKFANQNTKIPDMASIYALVRTLMENYLSFNYLMIKSTSEDEALVRFLFYKLGGLNNRQKFTVFSEVNCVKLAKEKKQMELLENQIRQTDYFRNLPEKKQINLLRRKPARLLQWPEIIRKADLDHNQFETFWRLCSNYAHSEFIGLIQTKYYLENPDELKKSRFIILAFSLTLVCLQVIDLTKVLKRLEIALQTVNPRTLEIINLWYRFGSQQRKSSLSKIMGKPKPITSRQKE